MLLRKNMLCGSLPAGIVIALGLLPATLAAQTGAAKAIITGHVVDAADAAVPGAKVQLTPLGVNVVSDEQGAFRMPEVPAGSYSITV